MDVLLRVLSYIALPVLAALFAWLATFVPGVSWDPGAQVVAFHLPTLLGGLGVGGAAALAIFAKWGNKEPRKRRPPA